MAEVSTINGRALLGVLGSWWNLVFPDRDTLLAHLDGVADEHMQTVQNLQEAIACVSRLEIPPFHREEWTPLRIRRSQLMTIPEYFERYLPETTRTYGDGLTYGARAETAQAAIPLTNDLVDVQAIYNRIMAPSLSFVKDEHYVVTPTVILLDSDPFDDPLMPQREIVDGQGLVVDVEILLWGHKADYDWGYLWEHVGYVLGVRGVSSEEYKTILNAVWDSRLLGFSQSIVDALLAATTGIPHVIEVQETIQRIENDGTNLHIETDVHEYAFSPLATAAVHVGQVVAAGDPLTDGWEIKDLSGSSHTLPAWVTSVLMDEDFMSGQFVAPVAFPNEDVQLVHGGYDEDGRAMVEFEVHGFPGDVEALWENLHQRGIEGDKTLANYMDVRGETALTEPGPASLPATVNPAQFLVDNLVGRHLFIMRVKPSQFQAPVENIKYLRLLRGLLPPHTTFMIFVEVQPAADEYDLEEQAYAEEADSTIGLIVTAAQEESELVLEDIDVAIGVEHIFAGFDDTTGFGYFTNIGGGLIRKFDADGNIFPLATPSPRDISQIRVGAAMDPSRQLLFYTDEEFVLGVDLATNTSRRVCRTTIPSADVKRLHYDGATGYLYFGDTGDGTVWRCTTFFDVDADTDHVNSDEKIYGEFAASEYVGCIAIHPLTGKIIITNLSSLLVPRVITVDPQTLIVEDVREVLRLIEVLRFDFLRGYAYYSETGPGTAVYRSDLDLNSEGEIDVGVSLNSVYDFVISVASNAIYIDYNGGNHKFGKIHLALPTPPVDAFHLPSSGGTAYARARVLAGNASI